MRFDDTVFSVTENNTENWRSCALFFMGLDMAVGLEIQILTN